MVNVTLKAAMRHGDLHMACKKVGSMVALAEFLGVPYATVGSWYRYTACPPASENLPHWPQARIDDLEKKLFSLTGKLLDDLFPDAVRDQAFLDMEKTVESTKEIDSHRLIELAKNVRGIEYREPDAVEQKELSTAVHASLGALDYREREIVKMRYGIGCEPMTLKEVANVFKLTQERIRMLELRAMGKLAKPNVTQKLVGHLS
jgi:RNA polymerase sigma factor (sigma-70 family)